MKTNTHLFFRSLYLTLTLIFCILTAVFGISKAYEETVKVGFGENKKAVEIIDGKLRILDFEFEF